MQNGDLQEKVGGNMKKKEDRRKKKSARGVRLASLPAVGEEKPGFPLWLRPSLIPAAPLLFTQNAKQLSVTLCDVSARQQHTHKKKNSLEQLDLNMHAHIQHITHITTCRQRAWPP